MHRRSSSLSISASGGRAGCRSFGCTAHNLVCTPTNRLHRREEVEPGPVASICGAHRMERELPSGCCRGLSTACGPAMVHVRLPESLSEDEGLDLQREPPKRLEPTGVGPWTWWFGLEKNVVRLTDQWSRRNWLWWYHQKDGLLLGGEEEKEGRGAG